MGRDNELQYGFSSLPSIEGGLNNMAFSSLDMFLLGDKQRSMGNTEG